MIKAVIFDFDGLILDTETVWYEAYRETMAFYKSDLPLEHFVTCIGTDNTELNQYFKDQLGEGVILKKLNPEQKASMK